MRFPETLGWRRGNGKAATFRGVAFRERDRHGERPRSITSRSIAEPLRRPITRHSRGVSVPQVPPSVQATREPAATHYCICYRHPAMLIGTYDPVPSPPEPTEYVELLDTLKERIRSSRLRAALAVNEELTLLY